MFWENSYLLPYVQLQQIRGLQRNCDFSGRPGYTELYGNYTCVTTYSSDDFDDSNYQGQDYVVENKVVAARGIIYSFYREGYFKNIQVKNSTTQAGLNQTYWAQLIDQNLIQPRWIDN